MIIWLASYPKSGNTLLRSILATYFFSDNGEFKFEHLYKIDQFPSLHHFKNIGLDVSNEKVVFQNFINAQKFINKEKNKIKFLKKKFKNLNYKKLSKMNLHSQKINTFVSMFAKKKKIRSILKTYQLKFAKKYKKICIEGRDISYVILPSADIKFFFTCDIKIAAKRRWKELKRRNKKIKLNEVEKSLKIRDFNDKNRKHNPLIKSSDSIVIRTDILNKSAMVKKMSQVIENKLKQKYGFRN